MRKLFFLLLMVPALLLAAPVDPNLALQVAENFINAPEADANNTTQKVPRVQKRMARVPKRVVADQQFYIFNSEDGEGFVIVAADDVARPILGYSKTGTLDMENMPSNKKGWLSMYNDEIKYAQDHNFQASVETQQAWAEMLQNKVTAAEVVVAPLLTTTWGQNLYYNMRCPIITKFNWSALSYESAQAPTGCAATALAQVMKYWNWPIQGKGAHQYWSFNTGTLFAYFGGRRYDWSHMPDSLNAQSTEQEKESIAILMSDCGIAMDMKYGLSTSGIESLTQVESAVKNYFGYSASASTIKCEDYSAAQWIAQIKNQLNLGRPMVYSGMSLDKKSGHAFVCDGYDNNSYFHFNWGWNGDEQEEYYSLAALTPGGEGTGAGGHNYTYYQSALVGMVPDSGSTAASNLQMSDNLTLSKSSIPYGGSVVLTAKIKNIGNATFKGDIKAIVVDTAGYFVTEITLKENYTIGVSNTATISYTISNNALIVPGQYLIILVSDCPETGLVVLGSNSYFPYNVLDVTYSAPIEKKSAFGIYSDCNNELVTGRQIWFRVSFANTSSSTFLGRIALALYDPETLQLAQVIDEISFALTGIGANEERTVNFIDTVRLEPKSYLAALVYSNDGEAYKFVGSTYSQNPCMIRVIKDPAEIEEESDESNDFQLKPGNYVIVANRSKEDDKNWYYMTSDLGTASTKRFQAVSTGTEDINEIAISNLENKYVWTLEAEGDNWKLKNGTQYVTWSSGNSANLGSTAKSLTFDVTENQVLAHFKDGSAERYLSLNAVSDNNYFAFYSGTNQIEQLFFLPYDESSTPVTPPVESNRYIVLAQRNKTSNWFYMTSDLGTASNKRYQAVDAGTSTLSSVNSSNLDSKYYWEIDGNKLKTAAGYSTWISGNSADFDATGKELTIQQQTDGTYTFSFVDGTDIRYLALNATAGNDYFAYYKGANHISKLTFIKEGQNGSTTPIPVVDVVPQVQKILHNGQLFILRGDCTYTLTGQEVR